MTTGKLRLVPISVTDAAAFVSVVHRHLPNPPSIAACFAVGVAHGQTLVGVAMGGRPSARALDDGLTFEVHRVAVVADAPRGACSCLLGAMRRAAGALGYRKITTTTLASESGASLRGAGFVQQAFLEARGGWDCESRPRRPGPADNTDKIRWEVAAP